MRSSDAPLQDAVIAVIAGPTASGKSALAMRLAARHADVEIVSADSRQVYRGLDIGTAKPTTEDRRRVRHHLIDIIPPSESYSAGKYASDARTSIDDVLIRGGTPVVVGGSGFYIRATFEGLTAPAADPEVYDRLEARLKRVGGRALWDELHRLDPMAARGHAPQNVEKTMRALACIEQTGRPYSEFLAGAGEARWNCAARYIAVDLPREVLYARIDRRVEQMIADGLEDETRAILESGVARDAPGLRTVGYKEMVAYIDGVLSHDAMVAAIQQATRRYAKRQMTWLRRIEGVRWLDATRPPHEVDDELEIELRRIGVLAD